jgi:hypothetical protein
MNGGALDITADMASPQRLAAALPAGARELRWARTAGQTVVLASAGAGRPVLLDARSGDAHRIDPALLRAAVARLVAAPVVRVDVLDRHDLHYYARDVHTMTGGGEKPLPAWRVVFADASATWVHIDPATGAVIGRTDSGRRLGRWLFAMLHSWDWLPLLARRPLWDALLIALSAGGAVLSLTGVVIGWRRLGRRARPPRRVLRLPMR